MFDFCQRDNSKWMRFSFEDVHVVIASEKRVRSTNIELDLCF